MITDRDIEQIVRVKVGSDFQFQQKELVKESHRSSIYRYDFMNHDSATRSIIFKYYREQTNEAIIYTYFHTHQMLTDIIVHCGVDNGHTFILLHDISKTHRNLSAWQPPVAEKQLEKLVRHIAHFHSSNWQNYADIVQCVGLPWHLQSEGNYRQHLDYLRRDFNEFRDNLPFPLTTEHLDCYDEALEGLLKNEAFLFEHLHKNSIFTFSHGDLNVCNVFYPVAQNDTIVLLDYEALRVGLFSDDLVMLLIHDLYHGAPITKRLFDQYYQCVQADIKRHLTSALFERSMCHSITDGLFFPMKLFAQYGVKDQELVMKSLDAYERLVRPLNALV